MKTCTFRIEVNNFQTVKAEILNLEFQEENPKGKLGFEENKDLIKTLVQKARCSPNKAGAIKSEEIIDLGILLFDTLFEGAVRASFWKYFNEVLKKNQEQANSATLSIELEFDEDAKGLPLLASLPWEFLCAKDPQQDEIWLDYHPAIRFSRFHKQQKPLSSTKLFPGKALRIALVVTEFEQGILERHELGQIDAESIRLKLRTLAENSSGKIEFIDLNKEIGTNEVVDISTLDNFLGVHRPHIFHFIGHGQFNDRGEIALVDSFGHPEWVSETNFCKIFEKHRPSVVVLQSCQGGAKSAVNPNSGVGSHILRKQVPLVVAMQYEISNIAANTFAEEFYRCLANEMYVKDAVQEGRRKMHMILSSYGTRDFATPMLFVNRCEHEDPIYRDPDLERLWKIIESAAIPLEKITSLLEDLVRDLGQMSNIKLPAGRALEDWFQELYSLLAQRWNASSNKWDYSLREEKYMHPFQWLIENIAFLLTPSDSSEKLKDWNDQRVDFFKTTPSALKDLRQHLIRFKGKVPESASILLITISSQAADEKNYFIHADYYYEGVWRPQGDTSVSKPEDNIKDQLVELLDRLASLQLSRRKTSIGFLVPAELISFDFERVKNGAKGDWLGKIFPVVVRAYGRDQAPYQDYMDYWLNKWEEVKSLSTKLASDVMNEFDETLLRSPDSDNLKAFSQSIFPVFKGALSQDFAGDWTDLLCENGTSIALWLRTTDINELNLKNYQERIQTSLLSKNLHSLPEMLKEMRKISSRIPGDVGNYLVLLWDDPDQLPNYDKQASIGI